MISVTFLFFVLRAANSKYLAQAKEEGLLQEGRNHKKALREQFPWRPKKHVCNRDLVGTPVMSIFCGL